VKRGRGGDVCVPRGRRASFAAPYDGCDKKGDLVDRAARINKTSGVQKMKLLEALLFTAVLSIGAAAVAGAAAPEIGTWN